MPVCVLVSAGGGRGGHEDAWRHGCAADTVPDGCADLELALAGAIRSQGQDTPGICQPRLRHASDMHVLQGQELSRCSSCADAYHSALLAVLLQWNVSTVWPSSATGWSAASVLVSCAVRQHPGAVSAAPPTPGQDPRPRRGQQWTAASSGCMQGKGPVRPQSACKREEQSSGVAGRQAPGCVAKNLDLAAPGSAQHPH